MPQRQAIVGSVRHQRTGNICRLAAIFADHKIYDNNPIHLEFCQVKKCFFQLALGKYTNLHVFMDIDGMSVAIPMQLVLENE